MKASKLLKKMAVLCEICQGAMDWTKQKYTCKACHYIKPCCEGDIYNE